MRIFLAVGLLLISFSMYGQAKRALSFIEKQKYASAFDLLQNGYEKDSTSAAIPFILANLYLTNEWPKSNLDSAFYFSVLSLSNYAVLSEKALDKHIKDGFGKTRLLTLKKEIDHTSFLRAKSGGLEANYQLFIDDHGDAIDIDSALFLRNEQAYKTAGKTNSLQSYKYFLEHYRQANDWQDANKIYQAKLYKENTISGKLKEYISFAKMYPESPYYEICTQEIYFIIAGKYSVKTLLQFVDNYPNTMASTQAIGNLYHLHIEHEPASTFADSYPRLSISDSLIQVIKQEETALIPTWTNNFLQLVNFDREIKLDSLTSMDISSLDKDFISAKKNERQQLINKNGEVFYSGEWRNIIEEKNGIMLLELKTGIGLVQKNVSHNQSQVQYVLPAQAAQLIGPFVAFKNDAQWGLNSITNKLLVEAKFDSIWYENNIIFLELEERISLNKPEVFYPALDKASIDIGPFYEEYEWLNDSLIWVGDGGKEALLTDDLIELIPLKNQRIDLVKKGWSISAKNNTSVPEFSNSTLAHFEENTHWQIGQNDSLLIKYNYDRSFSSDRAVLLGPSAVLMNWGDSSFVYLTDTIRFYKPETCHVKPVLNQRNEAPYFELIEDEKKWIINRNGEKLDLPDYEKIIALNQAFFQLVYEIKSALYNSDGELLLDEVDGVSLINDSTLSILQDQKFGLLIHKDSVFIEAEYDKKLTHLIDSFWVCSLDEKYGLINLKNDQILPVGYDAISYWTNGLVFLKNDLKWSIYDLKSRSILETGIITYESITKYDNPIIRYQKGVGIGIFHSIKGIIIKPTLTAVYLEGTSKEPYYRAEKYVEEASLHIMLYYNMEGLLMFKNIMSEEEYVSLFGNLEQ